MLNLITLEEVLRNSRIDTAEENEYIESLIAVAEDMVPKMLNCTWESLFEEYGECPAPVRHAMLMLVDHLYQHRSVGETVAIQSNPAFATLLRKYKKLR